MWHVCARAAWRTEEVVGLETVGDPEGDVLEARRVLGVGFEGCDLTLLELLVETVVIRPEEADCSTREAVCVCVRAVAKEGPERWSTAA